MMKSMEQLGRQLSSLQDLQTLVRTMKALSAASIVQYERSVAALADYVETVELGLQVALRETDPKSRPLSEPRTAAVIFGSDHGLCGRFNEDVVQFALGRLAQVAADPLLLVVGGRIEAGLASEGARVHSVFRVPSSAGHITRTVQEILVALEALQDQQAVRRVLLFHKRPEGRRARIESTEMLPLSAVRVRSLTARSWPSRRLPSTGESSRRLVRHLLRHWVLVSLFRACAESLASEHASRLAAMQAAERSLAERTEELQAQFRWARQTAITAELLDVVSGFEATKEMAP